MALDAAMVRVAADELDLSLKGARVDKIYMPSRDEAVFSVRTRESRKMLFLSARSGAARAHITSEEFDYPAVPPAFCMLLRTGTYAPAAANTSNSRHCPVRSPG